MLVPDIGRGLWEAFAAPRTWWGIAADVAFGLTIAWIAAKVARRKRARASRSRAFATQCSALLVEVNGGDHSRLSGLSREGERAEARTILKESWDVNDADSSRRTLAWLEGTGHRAAWASENPALEPAGLAWDFCRLGSVARMSHGAGYLSGEETRQWLERAAAVLAGSFGSWNELGRAYLEGRERWKPGSSARFVEALARLTDPSNARSPWVSIPWPQGRGPGSR